MRIGHPGGSHLATALWRSTWEVAAQMAPALRHQWHNMHKARRGRAWRARPRSTPRVQDRPPAAPEAHAKHGAAPGAPSLETCLCSDAQQKEQQQLGLQETQCLEGADLGQDMEPLPEAQGKHFEAHRKKARKTAMEYEQRQCRAVAMACRTARPGPLTLNFGVFVAEACRAADLGCTTGARCRMHRCSSWRNRLHPASIVVLVATLVGGIVGVWWW